MALTTNLANGTINPQNFIDQAINDLKFFQSLPGAAGFEKELLTILENILTSKGVPAFVVELITTAIETGLGINTPVTNPTA